MNNVATLPRRRAGDAPAGLGAQRVTRIYLLGVMRAIGPEGEDVLPRAKKAQAVLAYLCLSQGERVARSRLAGVIWDRSGEAQARDSLRHALSALQGTGTWRLERDGDTIRLDTTSCWIDAFEAPDQSDLLLDGLQGISPAFDQWLLSERVRFENRWQGLLEAQLQRLSVEAAGPELRAAAARKLLNFVPAHEMALRTLMLAFVEMDDRPQAIREYERFRQVVNATLGLPPSATTVALYEAIRRDAIVGSRRQASDAGVQERPVFEPQNGSRAAIANAITGSIHGTSIAVLPLRNLSGQPECDYVAEGVTEDLVEALSRVPGLFVISRLSAAAFRSQDRAPTEIGEALGVRYVVSGSIRLNSDRIRLIVELADATDGAVLWVSNFDDKSSDLLELQNRLAATVVRHVAPHLRVAELKRIRIKRPEQQDAYDFLLRAQEDMHNPLRAVFEHAERYFEEATNRAAGYAAALAWRAYWHVMRVGQGWSPNEEQDIRQAEYFARCAVDADPAEPMAFAVQGHAAAFLLRDFDRAFACFDAALQINPNSARAWLWCANANAWLGQGKRAVEQVNRAMALSPYDPLVCAFSGGASIAYLADGQYDRAIEFALRCVRENRGYTSAYKLLILGLALSGREAEARSPLHRLLFLEPGFSVRRYRDRFPGRDGPLADPFCMALLRAGAPP